MAEVVQLEVKFDPRNRESVFGLQFRTEVKKGTIVEWVIKDPFIFEEIVLSKTNFIRGLKFTVYFEGSSAFEWKTESLRLQPFPPNPPYYPLGPLPLVIASGKAQNTGDHKYGLKLESLGSTEKSEPEYDDDPYLIVF